MEGTKFVKARCRKTGQYFALEVKKIGLSYKVVNFTFMTDAEAALAASEVEQRSFETNPTLLPCLKCGTRTVGGCACSQKSARCAKGMPYNYSCVYCKELEIDYSVPSAAGLGLQPGQTVKLSQGQEVKIRFNDKPLKRLKVQVGWSPATGSTNMDVDASVFVNNDSGSESDLVYFGEKTHRSGCVVHHGDSLTGDFDEFIDVYLDKVPQNRSKLIFVLNIYNCFERNQTLESVKNLFLNICDPDSNKVLVQYKVDGNSFDATAIVIGMAYKTGGDWTFRAIGRFVRTPDLSDLRVKCLNFTR